MREYWTAFASLLGVLAFCQSIFQAIIPPQLRYATVKFFNRIFHAFSAYCYFDITEIDGVNTNELYNAVQLYLSSSVSIAGNRLSLTRAVNSSSFTFALANNDYITDTFNGVNLLWEHVVTQRQSQTFAWRPMPEEKRGFTLRVKKKDKEVILNSYLDHIMVRSNEIRRQNEDRRLYTNTRGGGSLDSRGHPWEYVPFKHPSTFDTLAMDPDMKQAIMEDLRDFSDGKEFYKKTGRAWKRGYLLYGAPGTGKSSMIAAMANFLGYDIYDLELTEVTSNSELRKLLMKTSSKSIIVIEDIDCTINLKNRKSNSTKPSDMGTGSGPNFGVPTGVNSSSDNGSNSITLSGLLNFTDGLWSCCGSERIFVFTTNHIEKLDPALLRSGRMDMHINMSYSSFSGLKILLKNYLQLEEGDLEEDTMRVIRHLIDGAEMTPADISEVLIKNRRNREKAVRELVEALRVKAAARERRISSATLVVDVGEEEEEEEKRALDSIMPCGVQNDNSNEEEATFKKKTATNEY